MFFYSEQDENVIQPISDPYFNNVSLLLKMDSDFSDSSANAATPTVYGDSTVFNLNGAFFDGNADAVNYSHSADLNLDGDFTIEMWIYRTKAQGAMLFNKGGGSMIAWASYQMVIGDQGGVRFAASTNNAGYQIGSQTDIAHNFGFCPLKQWCHVAVTKSGNVYRGFINGVQGWTQTYTGALYTNTREFVLGANYNNTWNGTPANSFHGCIKNFRITKGVARYTSNFTPSATFSSNDPYANNVSLLLPLTSNFSDQSSFAHTYQLKGNVDINTDQDREYAGYFDGAGDYLTIPTTTELQFGTGDFTIETWIKLSSLGYNTSTAYSSPAIYSNYTNWGANALSIFTGHNGSNTTKYQVAVAGTFPAIQSSATIQYNTWVHVALVRDNGVIKLYIDGILEGSYNYSGTLNGVGGSTYIGTASDNVTGGYIHGHLDDFRITKGVARYTANFTPPESLPTS